MNEYQSAKNYRFKTRKLREQLRDLKKQRNRAIRHAKDDDIDTVIRNSKSSRDII